MGLEDFEKELAASKAKEEKEPRKKRDRSRSRDRNSKREHRHKHHSSRHHRDDDRDRDDRRSHKRSRHERETSSERAQRKRRERARDEDQGRSRRKHDDSSDDQERISRRRKSRRDEDEDDSVSGDDEVPDRDFVPPNDHVLDEQLADAADANPQRDSWMQAPSTLDVDYVQRKKKEDKSTYVPASAEAESGHTLKIHHAELNRHLADVDKEEPTVEEEPAQRDVNYTFGDSGAQWRMMKLKGIYRTAEETGRTPEDVALEKYGDLRDFDDAREEEIELDRRNMYGRDYVGKEKPSGELFEERRLNAGIRRPSRTQEDLDLPQGEIIDDPPAPSAPRLNQTELNRLKGQLMKAKMKKAANVSQLEAEYNAAAAAFSNRTDPDVVVLGAMDNRMLAGGRKGEVITIENKRGTERGLVKENEDMSIDDMVRQERRTKGQRGGEGLLLAEKIAKDAKFDNDLDYLDENATKLASRAPKSTIHLRNTAIQDYTRTNRILDSCPLCHHEDKQSGPASLPLAPIVSLATRVYLTLPTDPEISDGGAVIVPIQHHTNLLECDDDEWDEIRNFMKCLTRMYHDQGRDVLFYENAARPDRKPHAALNCVPIPFELGETAPAFFKEAILEQAGDWTQHKPLINTLQNAKKGMGKQAFKRSLAKEIPYFHVWFELDGGLGTVVEDEGRWPRGDLFAREVLGGMLDRDVGVVRRQGMWERGLKTERRVEAWRRGWRKFDWTRVLSEG